MSAKPNWTKPFILALILTALGGGAYWLEFRHKPASEEKEERGRRVVDLDKATVEFIKLIDPARTLRFYCQDVGTFLCKPGDNSKWDMLEPLQIRADQSNVNALLSSLKNMSSEESIDLAAETPEKRASMLKQYGLSEESRKNPLYRRAELKLKGGKELIVYFGDEHPVGGKYYVGVSEAGKFNDQKIYLVSAGFKGNFDKELSYWRDKKIVSMAAHEVESFDLSTAKGKIHGERSDTQWTIRPGDQPKSEPLTGDIENIDNLLSTVAYLTAKDFVFENKDDPKAKALLVGARPIAEITLQKQAEPTGEKLFPMTLKFFEKMGKNGKELKLYVTASDKGPLFDVEAHSKDKIAKSLQELRLSKLITSLERFTIKRIQVEGPPIGPKPLVLTGQDTDWKAKDEDHLAIDGEKIQNLLDKLSGNRVQEFLSAIPAGEKSGISLSLGDEKNEKKRKLAFWKVKKDKEELLYARDQLSKRSEAFKVDAAVAAALPWARDHFIKKEKK